MEDIIKKKFSRESIEKYKNLIENTASLTAHISWHIETGKSDYSKIAKKAWNSKIVKNELKKCDNIVNLIDEILQRDEKDKTFTIDADEEYAIDNIVRSFKKNYPPEIILNNRYDLDINPILLTQANWEEKDFPKAKKALQKIYRIVMSGNKKEKENISIEKKILKLFYQLTPQQRKDFCQKYSP